MSLQFKESSANVGPAPCIYNVVSHVVIGAVAVAVENNRSIANCVFGYFARAARVDLEIDAVGT